MTSTSRACYGLSIPLLVILTSIVTCQAGEVRILSESPNKKIAIVEERDDSGERDYYFVRRSSEKKLGFVLPPDEDISNVAVGASWNLNSSKVALVLFYGTKLSTLLLFSKADDGAFHQVRLRQLDPSAFYRQRTGKTIPQEGDGYSENAVGPWLDENTVALISGEAKQTEQPDQYLHLLVTFRAHLVGKRAVLSHLKLHGPLSNAQSSRFLKRFGNGLANGGDSRRR
jgi:hypothetical protein